VVTHQLQDVSYIASHNAVARDGVVTIVQADQGKADEAEFIMLADAKVHFAGNFAELRAATDPYLKKFQS
jgi:ABC-type sugar transport system ATPase subunit